MPRFLVLVALALLAGKVPARAQPVPASLQDSVREVCRSRGGAMVAIARIRRGGVLRGDPFAPLPLRPRMPTADYVPTDFGAGVLVRARPTDRPRILTNYHVVRGGPVVGGDEGSHRLVVTLSTRHRFPATIFAADPRSDLAILEIDALTLPTEMSVVTLEGEPAAVPEQGSFVLAFGNPYAIARDGSASASFAMVANHGRRPAPAGPLLDEETREKETIHHYGTLLHLDGRLNLGTSGGPLFDLDGEFVGLLTSLAALEGYEKSAGYAVAMDDLGRRVVDDLLKGHEVEYGFLGVEPLDFTQTEMAALPATITQASAARVGAVYPNSPANRGLTGTGGMFPGDVVLGVRPVTANPSPPVRVHDKEDLIREVGRLPPESVVELDVYRLGDRRRLTVRLRLGKWPLQNEDELIAPNTRFPDWRGLRVDFPTARRRHFGKPYVFRDAVLVTRVDPSATITPKGEFGPVRDGSFITHVNGQRVATPQEFHRITRTITGPATLRVLDVGEYEVK